MDEVNVVADFGFKFEVFLFEFADEVFLLEDFEEALLLVEVLQLLNVFVDLQLEALELLQCLVGEVLGWWSVLLHRLEI